MTVIISKVRGLFKPDELYKDLNYNTWNFKMGLMYKMRL